MKRYNNYNITAIYFGKKVITKVYHSLKLIWVSIRSCFGAGFWNNVQPWVNDEPFKN